MQPSCAHHPVVDARNVNMSCSILGLLNFRLLLVQLMVISGQLVMASRSTAGDAHRDEQLQLHRVTGHPHQRRRRAAAHHRFRALPGPVAHRGRHEWLIRPHLGTHALRAELHLRHRRLRLWRRRVLRPRRRTAGHTGRINSRFQRGRRLLQGEPRGRLQRADGDRAAERELRANGLPRRHERAVPARAPHRRGRRDGGMLELMRDVRGGGVLLQQRPRHAGDVRSHGLLRRLFKAACPLAYSYTCEDASVCNVVLVLSQQSLLCFYCSFSAALPPRPPRRCSHPLPRQPNSRPPIIKAPDPCALAPRPSLTVACAAG